MIVLAVIFLLVFLFVLGKWLHLVFTMEDETPLVYDEAMSLWFIWRK